MAQNGEVVTSINVMVYLVLRLALFLILFVVLTAVWGGNETAGPFVAALIATPFAARIVLPAWSARAGLAQAS